jgi:hypothetical protein
MFEGDIHCATTPCAYNIPKSVEKNSKIKAKDVFDYGKSKKCPKARRNVTVSN